jgi:hypothetical protein
VLEFVGKDDQYDRQKRRLRIFKHRRLRSLPGGRKEQGLGVSYGVPVHDDADDGVSLCNQCNNYAGIGFRSIPHLCILAYPFFSIMTSVEQERTFRIELLSAVLMITQLGCTRPSLYLSGSNEERGLMGHCLYGVCGSCFG